MKGCLGFVAVALCSVLSAFAQTAQNAQTSVPPLQFVQPQGQAAPPPVITLQDALDRAKKIDAQFQSSVSNASIAREDRVQARSSLLPRASQTTQYLGTQGNGLLPSGRFVSNDGVHMYRAWAVAHQDLTPETFLQTSY